MSYILTGEQSHWIQAHLPSYSSHRHSVQDLYVERRALFNFFSDHTFRVSRPAPYLPPLTVGLMCSERRLLKHRYVPDQANTELTCNQLFRLLEDLAIPRYSFSSTTNCIEGERMECIYKLQLCKWNVALFRAGKEFSHQEKKIV